MKLETHLHTSEVSPCGMVDARTAVRQYAGAGYGGIIVTDHFGSYSLDLFAGTPKEKAEQFFRGYRLAKEEGEQCGIAVLFGAEISLEEGPEDYLLYGITPAFILDNPLLYTVSLPELYRTVHSAGGLVVQAHPFREYCRPGDPAFLDGAEVFNGNPRHNSRNHLAAAFAEVNGLAVRTSGSDYHQPEDLARGGMVFDYPIYTEQDFAQALLRGEGVLIQTDKTGK